MRPFPERLVVAIFNTKARSYEGTNVVIRDAYHFYEYPQNAPVAL
jgi:hypothetical protein